MQHFGILEQFHGKTQLVISSTWFPLLYKQVPAACCSDKNDVNRIAITGTFSQRVTSLKCCTPGKNTPSRKVRKKMIMCESEFIQVAVSLLLHRLLTGKK
jgi:hypothetical protein